MGAPSCTNRVVRNITTAVMLRDIIHFDSRQIDYHPENIWHSINNMTLSIITINYNNLEDIVPLFEAYEKIKS